MIIHKPRFTMPMALRPSKIKLRIRPINFAIGSMMNARIGKLDCTKNILNLLV
jgi:hypothetical protein